MIEPSDGETPESMLDRLRDDRGLSDDEREALIGRLVERFPAHRLVGAARSRFGDLSGEDAEAVLRLVESFGGPETLGELADALIDQPELPPGPAWAALSLLDAAGLIEDYPHLLEWWTDLNEAVAEGDASLEALAAQLEEDPDGSWVALQGLAAVEPEVRAEIIAGLADLPGGPGLVSFLRMLAFAHDPATRWAALDALDERPADDPDALDAWRLIASAHPDPGVVERAMNKAGGTDELSTNSPTVVQRTLVTAVDGEGRATVVIAAREGDRWAGAAFLCHVLRGVVDVVGRDGLGDLGLDEAFEGLNEQSISEVLEGADPLAIRLLAGSVSISGPGTTPALRYWVERTVGPTFRSDAEPDLFEGWDPSSLPFASESMAERARAVLDACPTWADTSDLTADLAREIRLRGAGSPPDPRRDAGAYRFLFEHRLSSRVDLYARMLLWMAAFWRAGGQDALGRSALALAWQLADPQHDVPNHPFFVALTTMSLSAAGEAET